MTSGQGPLTIALHVDGDRHRLDRVTVWVEELGGQ